MRVDNKQIAELVLTYILREVKEQAKGDFCYIEDYSSTIASVLVDKRKKRGVWFNLGDRIIMAAGKGKCRVLALPADSSLGCCVITTQDATTMACVKLFNADEVELIVIYSDVAGEKCLTKINSTQKFSICLQIMNMMG